MNIPDLPPDLSFPKLGTAVAWHLIRFILKFCDSAAAFSPSSVLGRRDRSCCC